MRKILATILILAMLVTMLSGCGGKAEKDTIRIGYHTNYGGSGAVLLAVEKGYFEEQGLDVQLVAFASGPPTISALNNGTIDFAYIGQGAHTLVINGMGEIVCTQNVSNSEFIITRKSSGINSLEDLKGKSIAVFMGTTSEDTVNVALSSVGLKPSDVKLVNYDMAGAVSALESGTVDVACVWEEYRYNATDALGKDALVLGATEDFKDVYAPLASWVCSSDYIDENPETVQKFVTAMVKAQNYWAYNLNETCRIISEELDISLVNLMLGMYCPDIFTVDELDEYLENGYIYDLYKMQQEYFVTTYDGISPRKVSQYLHCEFMQQAVEDLK